MSGIIYRATNSINGKCYIGFTTNFESRRYQHEWLADHDSQQAFHRALRKHGKNAFSWEIIDESEDADRALYVLEPYYIEKFRSYGKTGYNMTIGGEGKRKIVSEQTKEKIRKINLDRNINFVTNGATEAARIRNTGKKQSEQHRLKRIAAICKKVEVDGITYESGKAAAKALKVTTNTISHWIKSGRATKEA